MNCFDLSSFFRPTCENDANPALFCLIRKGKRNDTNLSMYFIYFIFSFSHDFHPAAGGNQLDAAFEQPHFSVT